MAAAKRPNIVFLLSDDQPLRAMGHQEAWFHTPHMDRLAQDGVVFENGFVECSICCVSRASIMLGQHNATHLIQSFDDPLSKKQIRQSFPVLLRQAGYRTALLGKYGIGHTRAAPKELCLPAEYFDLWYGFQQGPSYSQTVDGKKRYLTSVMEEKAIRFMKETPADQPFMVYLCLPEPHGQGGPGGPWNYRDPHFEIPAPNGPSPVVETMTEAAYARLPEAIRKSKNNKIVGQPAATYTKYMETVRDYTARTDLAVGRIRAALKEMGREENTVIIFASDNGSMWGAHGIAGKWNMYEESIRVPMMIYDPRLPEPTSGVRKQMVLNYDLTATIMDVAGVPAPHMQGRSLVPVMKDPDAAWRKDWYYHHDVFSRGKGSPLPKCEGVRTERWKYIRYKDTNPVQEELFDLAADPKETENLAGRPEHAGILNQLRARNEELRTKLAKMLENPVANPVVRDSILLECQYPRAVVTPRWKYIAARAPKEVLKRIQEDAVRAEKEGTRRRVGWDGSENTRQKFSKGVSNDSDRDFPGYFDRDQLYDLERDPFEQKNLADDPECRDVLIKMQRTLKSYLSDMPHAFGEFTEGQTPQRERVLAGPLDLSRGEWFVSFAAQRNAAGAFRVDFSNGKQQVRLGVSVAADGTVTPQGAAVRTPSAPGLFKADTAYRVVLKFSNDGKDKGAVTRVKLFAAGKLPAGPDGIDWDVTTSGGKTGVTQDRVLLETLSGAVKLDNLRVGKTWNEVLQ